MEREKNCKELCKQKTLVFQGTIELLALITEEQVRKKMQEKIKTLLSPKDESSIT